MKFILLIEVIALLNAAVASYPSPDELIDYINSNQTLWRACRNFNRNKRSVPQPILEINGTNENATIEENFWKQDIYKNFSKSERLQLNFDARNKWKYCSSLNDIRNQGSCWSSWAVAAVSAMSDRLCIQSNGRENVYFSELDVMTCCMNCGSPCAGGILKNGWRFGVKRGVVSGGNGGCKPYTVRQCEYENGYATPTCIPKTFNLVCRRKCQSSFKKSYRADRRFLRTVYNLNDERKIMLDIYRRGPVTTTFAVHQDFLQYHSGIYKFITGKLIGQQSVKLLGWGEENGVKYWLAANSWGTSWGDNGFFKIIRGVNHLGIEKEAYAGLFGKKSYAHV